MPPAQVLLTSHVAPLKHCRVHAEPTVRYDTIVPQLPVVSQRALNTQVFAWVQLVSVDRGCATHWSSVSSQNAVWHCVFVTTLLQFLEV